MKTEEDEAFEDIERRQGGFQAKRQMAADKVQDETDMLTIAYLHGYDKGKKAALAQPAQEPADKLQEFCTCHETHPMECQGCRANRLAQPVQEPDDMTIAYMSGFYDGKKKRPWVGLTEPERNDLEDYCEMIIGKAAFDAIEAKLKERNHGT